jgi:hypothetical protein
LTENPQTDIEKIRQRFSKGVKKYSYEDLIQDSRNLLIHESMSALYLNINATISSSRMIIKELIYLIRQGDESIPEIMESILHFHLVDYIERTLKSADKGDPVEFDEMINFFKIFSLNDADSKNQGCTWVKIDLKKDKGLKQTIHKFLHSQMKGFAELPRLGFLENLIGMITFFRKIGISPDLWECQNMFYDLLKYPDFAGSPTSEISSRFRELGALLFFIMEEK